MESDMVVCAGGIGGKRSERKGVAQGGATPRDQGSGAQRWHKLARCQGPMLRDLGQLAVGTRAAVGRRMPRTLFLTALLLICACDSELEDADTLDAVAQRDLEVLESCSATDCGSWTPVYRPDKWAVTCVLDAAVAGESSHVAIFDVADGGARCHGETRVFLVGDGSAYVWDALDGDCDDVDAFTEYRLDLCQVDEAAVEACQAIVSDWTAGVPDPGGTGSGTPSCAHPSSWLRDCVKVEAPACG
jgi:hypothetical protein